MDLYGQNISLIQLYPNRSSVQVEAESALDMFKMYDAIKEEEPKTKKQLQQEAEENDIMCNFLPMVREYLSSKLIKTSRMLYKMTWY